MTYNSLKFKIWRSFKLFFKTEYSAYLILLLIFLFHLINNFIVVSLDNTPLTFDSHDYFCKARIFFHTPEIFGFRPPMIYSLAISSFDLFGVSQEVAMLGTGTFSLFALLLATYLLAKELHSREAGLLSVFILSSCPIVFGSSRVIMTDLLCVGWLLFSLLLMVQSRGFILLRFVIPLGIVMGLGMLTRVAFPLYIAGPLIYLLVKAPLNKKVCLNLLLILLIVFSMCSFWYIPHFYTAASRHAEFDTFILAEIESFDAVWEVMFEYIFHLLRDGMGIIILPLFFTMLFKRNKKGLKWLPLLLIWIIVPYSILSIFDFKNLRFVLPLLPAIVIIYSFFVLNIERTFVKKITIFIIVLLSITHTLVISYTPWSKVIYPLSRSYDEWIYQQFGLLRPWREDWKHVEIADVIKNTYPGVKKEVVSIKMRPVVTTGLVEIMNEEIFHGSLLINDRFGCDRDTWLSKVKNAHIVLFGEVAWGDDEDANEAAKWFMGHIESFELIKVVVLSDGSRVRVYKVLGPPSRN